MGDSLLRFLIDGAPVRGGAVTLGASYRELLTRRAYPPRLHRLLGELLAASVLLASTLKYRGSLIVQLQSSGTLRLLVVECSDALEVRAMASWEGEIAEDADLASLTEAELSTARLVITLDPKQGGQLYQGIVEVESGSIAAMLEHYLQRSEQLPSRLWLAADETRVTGLLLQRLGSASDDDEPWRRLSLLAGTVTEHELLELPAETLLRRLFAEESVRVFAPQPVQFHCPCSVDRVVGALRLLGRAEVDSIIAEQGAVVATCEFCNREYRFDPADLETLFGTEGALPENVTRH